MKTTHTLLAGGLLITICTALPIAGTMAHDGHMPYGYGQGYAPPGPYQMPAMPPHPAYGGYGGAPGYGYGPYWQPYGGDYPPPSKYGSVPEPGKQVRPEMQGMSGMPPQGKSDMEGMPGMQGMTGKEGKSGMGGMPGPQGKSDMEGMSGMQGAQALPAVPLLRGITGTYKISPSGAILLFPIAFEPTVNPTAKDSTEAGSR